MGTCSGCFRDSYNDNIMNSLEKSYVSTNIEEIEKYYLKHLSYNCDFQWNKNIYYIHPNRPY